MFFDPIMLPSGRKLVTLRDAAPHDFAVRLSAVRYRRIRVHRIPSRDRLTQGPVPR